MSEKPSISSTTAPIAEMVHNLNVITNRKYFTCQALQTVHDATWDLAADDCISPSVIPIF